MLVSILDVPFRLRCPHLREECYDGDDYSAEKAEAFFPKSKNDEEREELRAYMQAVYFPEEVQTGVYLAHNLHHVIEGVSVRYQDGVESARGVGSTHLDPWGVKLEDQFKEGAPETKSSYGVADNIEQILEYAQVFIQDPVRQYVIEVAPVRKEHQPESGGWRWHKWGPYIGTQAPQWEYLYDEPDIEEVWTFHIHEVRLPQPAKA